MEPSMKKIIVGITGATGAIYGIRLLQLLRDAGVETHLAISKWGRRTIEYETESSPTDVAGLATHVYANGDMGAAISSGSFITDGMIIAPCSMRTLAGIASGQGETLIQRAADVVIKERRRLVVMVRETPLSPIHLKNMLELSRIGVTIMPPLPAFYIKPKSLDEVVDHSIARVLDQLGIANEFGNRWNGDMQETVVKLTTPDR